MDNKEKVVHLGAITEPPFIMCRNEAAAERLRSYLHMDYARTPHIAVVDNWPAEWKVDAVAVTPIMVLGTEHFSSFSIKTEMDDLTRRVLNQIISWKRSHDGDNPSIRQIGTALGLSRRQVAYAISHLKETGIIEVKTGRGGLKTNFGNWRPDATKAKAFGIEIKEYT